MTQHLYHADDPTEGGHCAGCWCRPLSAEVSATVGQCPFDEEVEWREVE